MQRLLFIMPLVIALVSCNDIKPPPFNKDSFYVSVINDAQCYFKVNSSDGNTISGIYYSSNDAPCSLKRKFKASCHRKTIEVEYGNNRRKEFPHNDFEFTEYIADASHLNTKELFRDSVSFVNVIKDIQYDEAYGYWTSLPGYTAKYSKIILSSIKGIGKKNLPLTLDLYMPVKCSEKRPLIVFIHGGAFYAGDKQDIEFQDWCSYFSSIGYVASSINYRIGYFPKAANITDAAYRAIEDTNKALEYLIEHSNEYQIDTSSIFLAGTSAGAITALNVAFRKGYGHNTVGRDFHIRAVANMWGAVDNIELLNNSSTSIISFYGTNDRIVPPYYGHAFIDSPLSTLFRDMNLYGSEYINTYALQTGLNSKLCPLSGYRHSANLNEDCSMNNNQYLIRDSIKQFFLDDITGGNARITSGIPNNEYYIAGAGVKDVNWAVEGGFIMFSDSSRISVLWREDSSKHRVTAYGTYKNGKEYCVSLSL